MSYKKKLIEVALPLEQINAAASREKSLRHGHPSTLHLWWSRKPLSSSRAVIWASLVDDPSAHPEQFPTPEAQSQERQRLFELLSELVLWKNRKNSKLLKQAKKEIQKSVGDELPDFLDPFSGGGSLPFEAQRLGMKAYGGDLNPVAVMINKAMFEIPTRFAGQEPVHGKGLDIKGGRDQKSYSGLAEDVQYYAGALKRLAYESLQEQYPEVELPNEQGGGKATVIAWIWARTLRCPNPACACEMPLASSTYLSNKNGGGYLVRTLLRQ